MSEVTFEDFQSAAKSALSSDDGEVEEKGEDSVESTIREVIQRVMADEDEEPETEEDRNRIAERVHQRVIDSIWPERRLEIEREMHRQEVDRAARKRHIMEATKKIMEEDSG